MEIALDYDDTYSKDPELFGQLISSSKLKGYDIRFVTYRNENRLAGNSDIKRDAKKEGISIIFTNGNKKDIACRENDFFPDIWIDDDPSTILSLNRATARLI